MTDEERKEAKLARKRAYLATWREANADKIKAYREANRIHIRAKQKAYREANREKRRAAYRAWVAENPEKARAASKAWLEANVDKAQARQKAYRAGRMALVRYWQREWREANRERVQATESKRRSRKAQSGGSHTGGDRVAILDAQKWRCAYCKDNLKKDRGSYPSGRKKHRYHIDHIEPLALGGANDRRNLQALCPSCNCRKKDKHPLAFARELGKLL